MKELQALWNKWSAEQAEPGAPDASPAGGKAKPAEKKKIGEPKASAPGRTNERV
ncbi:MAG: hypothetical protein ACREEM_55520 [Blastocatellia bacterium]